MYCSRCVDDKCAWSSTYNRMKYCTKMDMSSRACTECLDGYTLGNGICAKPCSAGQYLYGTECYNCSAGEYSAGGMVTRCTKCFGMSWSSEGASSCSPCSSISVSNGTCRVCLSTGTCTAVSCNSGYRENGATCERVVSCSGRTPQALTQNDGSTKCSCTATSCGTRAECKKHPEYNSKTKLNDYSVCVCLFGYYDDGESCSACASGCSECSGPGACTACKYGYTLQNGECIKAATCTYPLKEVADYSGECDGCCTD